jgi:penicillin-binding protein 1A
MGRLLRRPRGPAELLALGLLGASLLACLAGLLAFSLYALRIERLDQGVGETVFFAADGRPWFTLDEQRRDVSLSEVSPYLRLAVVAVEDHRFYRHPGIDPVGLLRALWRNVRAGRVVEGGSTITQQLARTLFLSTRRTASRKAREALLALMIEQALGKERILELYLNRVYLGGGSYGVEAVSRRLFGKAARDLDLAESALVAGLVRAPSVLSPRANLPAARARARVVLARMRELSFITPATERAASAVPVRLAEEPGRSEAGSGWARDYLRQRFREEVGDDNPADWQVHTSFRRDVQAAAERAVAAGLKERATPDLEAALVALDPLTGDLMAMVGGSAYHRSPFNRAVHGRRQPGSAFKPLLFAAALQAGLSPVSWLRGLGQVAAAGEPEWAPRNAGARGPDEVTLREALVTSNNQAAVALLRDLRAGPVLRLAEDSGLGGLPDVPSLALGTGLVSPLGLTAAYAAFANGGYAVRPRALLRVLDASGSVEFEEPVRDRRVLSEGAAFQVASMLEDVVERGTATAARELGFPVAGKTGTTDGFRDAWFVGFSSHLVAGVWVGFDRPAPIGDEAYGARVALPIWVDFMRRVGSALPHQPFRPPDGMREVELCRLSYRRALDGCPAYLEYLKAGDEVPRETCPLHRGGLRQKLARIVGGLLGRLRSIFR